MSTSLWYLLGLYAATSQMVLAELFLDQQLSSLHTSASMQLLAQLRRLAYVLSSFNKYCALVWCKFSLGVLVFQWRPLLMCSDMIIFYLTNYFPLSRWRILNEIFHWGWVWPCPYAASSTWWFLLLLLVWCHIMNWILTPLFHLHLPNMECNGQCKMPGY